MSNFPKTSGRALMIFAFFRKKSRPFRPMGMS